MSPKIPPIIGQNRAFAAVVAQASHLATFQRPVLIQGERGSGKELIAARLHYLSPRWQHRYVTLNCAAVHENLIDAELFGAEAGAYTGAVRSRAGKLEMAHQGTLFLDEIASMPHSMQEKLLRFIEYGETARLGGGATQQIRVRVVAASNLDLPALANRGDFRWDLLDRLSFAVLTIPPLRHRRDDILPLAQHFATRWCQECDVHHFDGFSEAAMNTLLQHHWPGNVRELKNVIERSLAYAEQLDKPLDTIVLDPFDQAYRLPTHLGHDLFSDQVSVSAHQRPSGEMEPKLMAVAPQHEQAKATQPMSLKQRMAAFEQQQITQAMEQYGAISPAAKALGMRYHQLRHLLKKYAQKA